MTKKPFVATLSLTFLVVLAFLPVNGFADTVTIKPSNQDITISAASPTTNYNYLTSFSVSTMLPPHVRSLVQFDLSSIPAGSTIDSANLSIRKLGFSTLDPVGRIYWVYRVSQSWVEASATWNTYDGINPWVTPGSDYVMTGGASAVVPGNYVWMTWNVTDIVKAWIEDGQPNDGFVVMDGSETEPAPFQGIFDSGEAASNYQPILEISYTPYVGGDIIATNTASLLVPWILAAVILIGTAVTVRRRLH